ncbi:hypothetical protein PYCCODRAFT_1210310 [Trametes coccinea BRFM310]|uniref:Uncharacterized protein n=1 Tax=Trametes coccinea (strain BRFM310) TaxID=1353009 RepID=A0A1Y2I730_TRAC3|nr:hypothetical protein PYCCODRAFT_1210310 [Trametes coccinea BRFM310]
MLEDSQRKCLPHGQNTTRQPTTIDTPLHTLSSESMGSRAYLRRLYQWTHQSRRRAPLRRHVSLHTPPRPGIAAQRIIPQLPLTTVCVEFRMAVNAVVELLLGRLSLLCAEHTRLDEPMAVRVLLCMSERFGYTGWAARRCVQCGQRQHSHLPGIKARELTIGKAQALAHRTT